MEPLEYLYENQKRYKEKGPTPEKMKAIKLTSHAAAMNLVIEFPGNGMIPRQRFGPCSKLFVGASSEEGAETFVAHREVVQDLEHIK